MPHVDDGLLHEYLDGELKGAARDDVLAHLAVCAECRAHLEEERALVARAADLLARAAPAVRAPAAFATLARPRTPRWRIPAAWAASVMLAFVVGWQVHGDRPPARQFPSHVRLTDPAPPAEQARRETKAPPVRTMKPLERSRDLASTPPAAGGQARENDRMAISAAAPALADETVEQELDAGAARALLGRTPALLPGVPVRRMMRSPTDANVVVIEQEWSPGVVLRLHEQRAISTGRVDAAQPSAQRNRAAPDAKAALRVEPRGENLARYVSSLRVEISGPLASDSLARLLESVE